MARPNEVTLVETVSLKHDFWIMWKLVGKKCGGGSLWDRCLWKHFSKGRLGHMFLRDWHPVSWALILFHFCEESCHRWTTDKKGKGYEELFHFYLNVTAKPFQFRHSVFHREFFIFRETLMCWNFLVECFPLGNNPLGTEVQRKRQKQFRTTIFLR